MIRRGIIVLFSLWCVNATVRSQESDPSLSYPFPYDPGTLHYGLGASITMLPRAVVEEELRQIPMLNASLRYGLPSNVSITAQFSTVVITNVVSIGALWSTSTGPISIAVSDEFSYWFGFADFEGFDTKAMGLVNRPGVSAGIDIDGYKITSKTELLLLISQHTYFGSASVGRIKPELAGVVTSIILEQDLWNKTFMSYALRMNVARPNYQVWLAFSVQDRWLFFPEFQASLIF